MPTPFSSAGDSYGVTIDDHELTLIRQFLTQSRWEQIIREATRKSAKEIKRIVDKYYAIFTSSWASRHKRVTTKTKFTVSKSELRVYTQSKPFVYVAIGRRRRTITSNKPGGYLNFNWDGPGSYLPATVPGSLNSIQRNKRGGVKKYKTVNHPGNKPRRPDAALVKHAKDEMVEAFAKVLHNEIRITLQYYGLLY